MYFFQSKNMFFYEEQIETKTISKQMFDRPSLIQCELLQNGLGVLFAAENNLLIYS